jgi:SAM-dependent methyltransferase
MLFIRYLRFGREGAATYRARVAPIARPLRSALPERLRRRLAAATGIEELRRRIDALEGRLDARLERLETMLHESREDLWSRSRERWRAAPPTPDLTWSAKVTGDAFVRKAEAHGAFGPDRAVVEIGPGYGRLLESCVRLGLPFRTYTAVDLSSENVAHLRERFGDRDGVEFIHADAEEVELPRPIDSVISSLTFKHLFPSFDPVLRNLARQMSDDALAVFDLIEGERRYFEEDRQTYIRWYTRDEATRMVEAAGLEPVGFDEVAHLPTLSRLLVVARRPARK